MQLTINQNVLKLLRGAGFYPDTMLSSMAAVLAMGDNRFDILDHLDDKNTSKRMMVVYYDLVRKGLWTENKDYANLFTQTDEGAVFYTQLKEAMNPTEFVQPAIIPDPLVEKEQVDIWFDRWMDLWPRGVKTGGKLVRSDRRMCLSKMKSFVKANPMYDPEVIIAVTEQYISEFAHKDYQYMKSATYFIDKKGEGSELAALCENHKDTDDVPSFSDNSNFFI